MTAVRTHFTAVICKTTDLRDVGKTNCTAFYMAKRKPVSKIDEPHSPQPSTLDPGFSPTEFVPSGKRKQQSGLQSGDLQGLSGKDDIEFESVEELAAEGQAREAELVSGMAEARDPDQGEIKTHEVPADDVPQEYRDEQ